MSEFIFEQPGAPRTGDSEPELNVTFTPAADFVCQECGTELAYSGRGRKPTRCTAKNGGSPDCYSQRSQSSSTSRGVSSNKRTETALAVMEGMYDQLTQLLLIVSPNGATELTNRIPAQQKRNRLAFDANPALAQRICNVGSKGGTLTFLLSNLAMLAMVGRVAYADVMNMRQMVATVSAMTNGAGPANGQPVNLADLFGFGG